ncbi:sensor histidine kinase [Frankia nepalensis]|uniref:sensor histidine kinase n=1 Tax=Frankia nepalensis TaxID=1836974 RepID=UPI0027DE3E32|nr:histidine kinase [Frankia nepalensis]
MSSATVASDVLPVPPAPPPREATASPGAGSGHPLWRARPYRADVWLAAGLAVVMITVTLVSSGRAPYHSPDAVMVALAAVSALALAWRQAAPLAATAVTSVIVAVNAAAGYSVVAVQWPAWLALFSCFSVGGRGLRVAGTALCVLAVGGYALFDRGELTVEDLAGITMSFLIATVGGDAARSRRAVAAAQHARVRGEAREQALAAERLLHEERGRLAGELHDALGHTVNVMVLQAGVARRLFAENPAFARQALADIENVGREALGELDRMLRVLHPRADEPLGAENFEIGPDAGDGDTGDTRDRTGVRGLAELADRIRATGREVDLDAEPVDLSTGSERALYRIVREALTNAARHTHTGRIQVRVGRVADQIRVEVFNEGAGLASPVPGRGLIGMRERARLEGGSFEAGPVEGGFRVLATLPTHPATGS